jgi:hypothetical protein
LLSQLFAYDFDQEYQAMKESGSAQWAHRASDGSRVELTLFSCEGGCAKTVFRFAAAVTRRAVGVQQALEFTRPRRLYWVRRKQGMIGIRAVSDLITSGRPLSIDAAESSARNRNPSPDKMIIRRA